MSWIKATVGLRDNPKVMAMAAALNLDPDCIVGKALAFWSWAGEHTRTGDLPHASDTIIDALVRGPGFSSALRSVGWLVEGSKGGVRIPDWNKHNSKSAKDRALAAQRASRFRNGPVTIPSRSRNDESAPRAEQSKEQSSKEQAKKNNAQCSNAAAGAALGADACSMLAAAGLDDGAILHLMQRGGVDDCLIEYACQRLNDSLAAFRRGKGRAVGNPPGYVRSIIEQGKVPRGFRDAWTRKRMARQASALKLAGGAA